MDIVVFGPQGQIGHELMALCQMRGVAVTGIPRAEADITNRNAVEGILARRKSTIAVNCAAYTAVDRAEQESELATRVNAIGAENIAVACAEAGIRLIHLSTDYVFDGEKSGAYVESDRPAPLNVYGRSKFEGENRVQAARPNCVIIRTSWVYSPYGNNFVKTILALAEKRDELKIVSDQFGCPTAAIDIAEAVLAVAEKLATNASVAGIYHFAGQTRTNWYGFAREIVAQQSPVTGRIPKIVPISTSEYPLPAKRPANSELSSARFTATFGYQALPWRERVAETVARLLAADSKRAAS
jgi:dTDP-4-dehydrorhamnose reductase